MPHIFPNAEGSELTPERIAQASAMNNDSIKPLEEIMKNNHKVIGLFTLEEAYKLLLTQGWQYTQSGWQQLNDSDLGQAMSNFGANAIDAFHGGKALQKWGGFGINARFYTGRGGIELVRLEGDALRDILANNATHKTLRLTDPRLIDLGIGKTARQQAFTGGVRITLLFSAAYETLDLILNKETDFIDFIGRLAMDIPKAILAAAGAEAALAIASAFFGTLSTGGVFLIVVAGGLIATKLLNDIDNNFNITETLIAIMHDKIQQNAEEAIEEAKREIHIKEEYYTANPFSVIMNRLR